MLKRLLVWISIVATGQAARAETVLTVNDPGGRAAAVEAPVCVRIDPQRAGVQAAGHVRLVELSASGQPIGEPIDAQLDTPAAETGRHARALALWWLLPPGTAETRRFRLLPAKTGKERVERRPGTERQASPGPQVQAMMRVGPAGRADWFLFGQGDSPVLRYNHGTVPPPPGIDPKYARGDYIHPLYGLAGEVLTDDYPKDHPHHRGVSWSWPVTRWKNEVRDIWAVVGVWSRPVAVRSKREGPVLASLCVENVWKWGDQVPLVREMVVIQAFRQTTSGRFVDIEVHLEGLAEGVAIGGRPHAGYGGFGLRAAPAEQQKITLHWDPAGTQPRRSWIDYSGRFAGAGRTSGLAIFEHPSNPGYPSQLLQYPQLNYVMPAFPGQREVPLPRGQTLVLRHRLWIHPGIADAKTLGAVWASYAQPPQVTAETR